MLLVQLKHLNIQEVPHGQIRLSYRIIAYVTPLIDQSPDAYANYIVINSNRSIDQRFDQSRRHRSIICVPLSNGLVLIQDKTITGEKGNNAT